MVHSTRTFICTWVFCLIALSTCSFAQRISREREASASDEQPTVPGVEALAGRQDLRGVVSPDRKLSDKDLKLVIALNDYLIQPRHPVENRVKVAIALGRLGHRYGMIALLATLRDEHDVPRVRQTCVRALLMIHDERVVNYVIEAALKSDDKQVWLQALADLKTLIGTPLQFDGGDAAVFDKPPPTDEDGRKQYVGDWLEYWKNVKPSTKLDRNLLKDELVSVPNRPRRG